MRPLLPKPARGHRAFAGTLVAMVVVFGPPAMPARASHRCIIALNRGAGAVAAAVARATDLCVRHAARSADGLGSSLRACVDADASGRVARAAQRVTRAAASRCLVPPELGPTSPDEVVAIARSETTELASDLLGNDFDEVDALAGADPTAERCRRRLVREALDLVSVRLKQFLRCKKPGLRSGEIDSAAGLAACFDALDPARSGPIASAQAHVDRALAATCAGVDPDSVLPGACLGAAEFPACIDARAACRACRLLAAADHLDAGCDLFDDGLANQSCPDPDEPGPVCGNGVVEASEDCDDGGVAAGDCCSATCTYEPPATACADDGDACTSDACDGGGVCVHEDQCSWRFDDVTAAAGLTYVHAYDEFRYFTPEIDRAMISGGVAVGDYDRDGWPDVYAVGGPDGSDHLLRNRGDGTFEDVTAASGVSRAGTFGSGPTFADIDGDGWLDLLVAGVNGTPVGVYRNLGDGTFADVTASSGVAYAGTTFGASLGDYDRDGDLDLFLSHWSDPISGSPRLWRNDGGVAFTDVTVSAGLELARGPLPTDWSFTGNFADVDSDGWPDLLVASDFGSSQVFRNDGDGTFSDITTAVIDDENGMGAGVGDYDGDGDLDWFVTSVWDPDGVSEGNWGVSGNRLYRNLGDGTFEDATDEAGVRQGYWGWAACMADLDLDGHLDLFHVNGFGRDLSSGFADDPSRLFLSAGDGTFAEMAAALGIADDGQGRGLSCFDYDRDGDLDLLVANNDQAPRLWRNRAERLGRHFLQVSLVGNGRNTQGIGARVRVTIAGVTQMREIRAGSNFVSQDPAVAHFGLGASTAIDELRVDWPDGATSIVPGPAVDQFLEITHPGP